MKFSMLNILVLIFLVIFSGFSAIAARNAEKINNSLQIVSAKFAADPYSKAGYEPFIKLRVYNDSPKRIYSAIINCRLISNGREVYSELFTKHLSGGLPAYASQVWIFFPRRGSFWSQQNIPYDAIVEAEVEKIFYPTSNSPWQPEYEFDYPSRVDLL
ncbi:MAG: hypothetical protein ACQETH_15615 [Candidatus Rifleibacteriota bacterium]